MGNPKYESITNGQQLIDAGVIPKTSSAHLALITYRRAEALRDKALASLNDEMLGRWEPVTADKLNNGIVVDPNLGHRVRLTQEYRGRDPEDQYNNYQLPAGFAGLLHQYQPQRQVLWIKTDAPVPGQQANKKLFGFPILTVLPFLEVSTLGQLVPEDKEELVAKYVMKNLFPRTIVDYERARRIFAGIQMNRDMIFDGPPGAGKTQMAKDIISIAMQQEYIFTTGCQSNCHPFSIFDTEFAKICQPCGECMIKFDTEKDGPRNFKDTGIFHPPKPKDVKVVVAKYDFGHGIERRTGSIKLQGDDLIGYKLPRLDGSTTDQHEDHADPTGFRAGPILRANNGILHFDEMDKCHNTTLDVLLQPLEENTVSTDQLRYQMPAHTLIIGTANNNEVFDPWINDRLLLFNIPYTDDPDVAREITKRGYHKIFAPLEDVSIADTHREEAANIRDIPMPIILENAVNAWYIKFRSEFPPNNQNWQEVFGSERCKKDALDAARALLRIDRVSFSGLPEIVDADYAMQGIGFALRTMVQNKDQKVRYETKQALHDFVQKHYPEVLDGERKKWWCDADKQIATRGAVMPEIMDNYKAELEVYKENIENAAKAFESIRQARTSTGTRAQLATVKLPFMDFLFDQQPHITKVTKPQLLELMAYFIKAGEGVACKL